jgi:hypothetical protein
MRWSLDAGEPVAGLIAAAIWRYWHQQAELREGEPAGRALAAAPGAADDLKARILGAVRRGGLRLLGT